MWVCVFPARSSSSVAESRCQHVVICHLNNWLLMLQVVSLQRDGGAPVKRVLLCDQQGVRPLPPAAPPRSKSLRGGIVSHWGAPRRPTRRSLHHGGAFGVPAAESPDSSRCNIRRGSYPPTEPPCRPAAQPRPPPCCHSLSPCQVCCSGIQCRFCYNHPVWEQSVTPPAPSVSSSVLIGRFAASVAPPAPPDPPSVARRLII